MGDVLRTNILGKHLIKGHVITADLPEPLYCFSTPGGGGGCPVRQRGRPPESQRPPEPHQPDCCGQAWPSTFAVQGKIKSNLCKLLLLC